MDHTADSNYEAWRIMAEDHGVTKLFEYYVILADTTPAADIRFNKARSVAVHLKSSPLLSLHLKKSSATDGLWIGYSRTNLGHDLHLRELSTPFQKRPVTQGNNSWFFGYFKTTADLDHLFRETFGSVAAPGVSRSKPHIVHVPEANHAPVSSSVPVIETAQSLASVSIDDMFALAAQQGIAPRKWGSYQLQTYNGFTHEQRVHKWQALHLAIQMGLEQPAHLSPCSICGKTGGPDTIAYHSEDYSSLTGHHPLCKGCHTRIHNRFTNPQRWRDYISPYCTGSKWFEAI
jgi:hypothetical protein